MNDNPIQRSPGKRLTAHAANDAAVLKAYGWPPDLSEPEIVSRLFDMYAKRTSVSWNGGRDSV